MSFDYLEKSIEEASEYLIYQYDLPTYKRISKTHTPIKSIKLNK